MKEESRGLEFETIGTAVAMMELQQTLSELEFSPACIRETVTTNASRLESLTQKLGNAQTRLRFLAREIEAVVTTLNDLKRMPNLRTLSVLFI